jgi:hypothetical protein
MKRNEFIRNMSFIGVGLSLAPWNLATANPSIQRLPLPPSCIHIPHGNFAVLNPETVFIQELNLTVSIQYFMRNGIKESANDLTVYSFSKEGEILNLGHCQNTWAVDGKVEGISPFTSFNELTLRSANHELKLEIDSSEITLLRLS